MWVVEMPGSLLAPQRDIESEFYWRGLQRRELLLQRCSQCAKTRFPAMPACCFCGADASEQVRASGRGRLYSWVVVHHAFNEHLAAEVPYAIGTIELDEGCRMVARLDRVEGLHHDQAMTLYFVDHNDWTEARFAGV